MRKRSAPSAETPTDCNPTKESLRTVPKNARRRLVARLALALCGALGPFAQARAQDAIPGRLDADSRAALVPGLSLAIEADVAGRAVRDVRIVRAAALHVPAGSPPSSFVPAGRFQAVLSGYLKVRLRESFRFELAGRGTATVSFNGQVVLRAGPGDLAAAAPVGVELAKGYDALRIEYAPPETGDATLRLYWSGAEFPREPLPIAALLCDSRETGLRVGEESRRGRFLVGELQCAKCHALPTGATGLPELRHDAPFLGETGRRLEPAWLAAWIRDPTQVREHTTMPRLLHAGDQRSDRTAAADLAAYLATLSGAAPAPAKVAATDTLVAAGERLFELRGCLACHRFTAPGGPRDEFDRLSLHFAAAKYKPGALAEFLRDTRRHYRWSRMPQFDLSQDEAAALEAFVRNKSTGRFEVPPAGDAGRGKESFAKLGCSACHATDESRRLAGATHGSLFRATTESETRTMGCLAEGDAKSARAGVPVFDLNDADRAALLRFVQTDGDALRRDVPAEFSRRQIARLRCTACHERDDQQPPLPLLVADEGTVGLPPDAIPPLTWAGEKMRSGWLEQMLSGKLDYRLRDHFHVRMPAFPDVAAGLAQGLDHEHGFAGEEDRTLPFDAGEAQLGAKVAAAGTGLACNRCHAIGPAPPTVPEQALSTNLSFARRRLRHEFFQRWMLLPQRVDERTRMVRFSPDGRTTPLTAIHGGDARKQFDALWQWLHVLDEEERRRPKSDRAGTQAVDP